MPGDAKRVRDLFLAAAELPTADREPYLTVHCGDDVELRAAVERLLAAHDNPASVLNQPAPGIPTADYEPIVERVGSKIGPYRLMEQIGEGGFGLVFVAEQQEPVKRKVALKVIKPGMDSRQVIARFEAERQALALMDHPNIARVLDAGATESGRPYFVIELVRGIPITDYCDQNQLTPKDRLELFITVCQAIQHAHQKGIIHRDIKPSNVLVTSHDGKPVAKVIDFGVAKAISQSLADRTVYTQFAQMIGTPLYMSPEQAEMSGLDIDTRSDIYSLGVLLYELLTGTTPLDKKRFAKAAYDEIRRLIREEEPPKPSTRLSTTESLASIAAQRHTEPAKLSKLVRGDLDWITMKCLEKDRTRRYETANGLARDIQRYLGNEPVEACPPSATYRLRKFARKNRAALTTAATIALVLVTGIAISTWQAYRATRAERSALASRNAEAEQRQKAETAAESEKNARKRAETAEADAKRDLAKFEAINEFLTQDLLTQAEPAKNAAEDKVTLLEVLDRAAAQVGDRFAAQPELEAELRATIAHTYHGLASWENAERQWAAIRDSVTRRLGAESREALIATSEVGHILHHRGRTAEALPLLESARKGLRRTVGENHPATIQCMGHLAGCYQTAGKLDLALPLYEEVVNFHKVNGGADHTVTLKSICNLASGYRAAGKLDLALPLIEETLKLQRAKLGANHPHTLRSMDELAQCYRDAGKLELALPLWEETLTLMKAKLGADHSDTLESLNNLASAYEAAGKPDLVVRLYEETLTLLTAKLGADHSVTLGIKMGLASGYRDAGRIQDALKLDEETLQLRKATLGPDHADTLASTVNLAGTYHRLDRFDDAIKLFEEALPVMKAKMPDHPWTYNCMSGLANCYTAVGRTEAATRLFEETLQLQKAKLGPDHPDTLSTMNLLAFSFDRASRTKEALKLREESLELWKAKLGADHLDTIWSMYGLTSSYDYAGRTQEALKLQEACLPRLKAKLGLDHLYTMGSMVNLANSYHKVGRIADAIKLYEEALPVMKTKMPDHTFTFICMGNLSESYAEAGRTQEALRLKEESLQSRTCKLGPDYPDTIEAMSSFARMLATGPDAALRNPKRAVELASQAVAKSPKKPDFHVTLGIARYRTGDWKAAIVDLEKALSLRDQGDTDRSAEGFFLAMAYEKLGEKEKAQEWFDKAVRWMEPGRKDHPALKRYRAEAAELFERE